MTDSFEDDSSLLAILLDVSPAAVAQLTAMPGLSLQSLLEQLLTFINAFTFLNDANRLAVFAMGGSACHLAYCSADLAPQAGDAVGATPAPATLGPPSAAVLAGLQQVVSVPSTTEVVQGRVGCCQLSSALSRALCYLNSQQRRAAMAAGAPAFGSSGTAGLLSAAQQRQQQQRVLCLSAAPDVPAQYIAVMNAIFSAQRSGVLIDGCQLGTGQSTFLQQAAYLTGGVYLKATKPQALTQYLNSVFALDAGTRKLLRLPGTTRVDFRASCFCHKRQIDLGYVCSACLSIFCQQLPACTTCGTEFQAGNGKK